LSQPHNPSSHNENIVLQNTFHISLRLFSQTVTDLIDFFAVEIQGPSPHFAAETTTGTVINISRCISYVFEELVENPQNITTR
jgi:hypothetical protein